MKLSMVHGTYEAVYGSWHLWTCLVQTTYKAVYCSWHLWTCLWFMALIFFMISAAERLYNWPLCFRDTFLAASHLFVVGVVFVLRFSLKSSEISATSCCVHLWCFLFLFCCLTSPTSMGWLSSTSMGWLSLSSMGWLSSWSIGLRSSPSIWWLSSGWGWACAPGKSISGKNMGNILRFSRRHI